MPVRLSMAPLVGDLVSPRTVLSHLAPDAQGPNRASSVSLATLSPEERREGHSEGLDDTQRVLEVQAEGHRPNLAVLADDVLGLLRKRQLEVLGGGQDVPALEVEHKALHLVVPNGLLRDQLLHLEAVIHRVGQVAPAQEGAPNHAAPIGVEARDVNFHAVEDPVTHRHPRVLNESDLLLPTAGARQVLRLELAVLAALLDNFPIRLVLVPVHGEGWPGGVVELLVLLARVVQEELHFPRL
mmetsp:Transcript_15211/g.40371  ORF Transcript_15211/g.40371 Transcript_15211/m.40371 type:complete len:241 (-) Transcript_15211:369-1091(-)